MSQITLTLPDDVGELDQSESSLAGLARESLFVRLYSLGRISSGRAAEVLRMSRREFLDLAGEYGVSIFDEAGDLDAEARQGL